MTNITRFIKPEELHDPKYNIKIGSKNLSLYAGFRQYEKIQLTFKDNPINVAENVIGMTNDELIKLLLCYATDDSNSFEDDELKEWLVEDFGIDDLKHLLIEFTCICSHPKKKREEKVQALIEYITLAMQAQEKLLESKKESLRTFLLQNTEDSA